MVDGGPVTEIEPTARELARRLPVASRSAEARRLIQLRLHGLDLLDLLMVLEQRVHELRQSTGDDGLNGSTAVCDIGASTPPSSDGDDGRNGVGLPGVSPAEIDAASSIWNSLAE